jgi:arylsulfatase
MQTRDGRPVRTGPEVMPGPEDTFIAYGRGWANVSNTPFREYKHWVHEGGISTPLIAHWPAGIEGRGRLSHEPGHLIDIMATCADLAGAERPREIGGAAVPPLEGVSLRPALGGKPLERKAPLFWEHEGNRAIREGKWKLVAKENQPWELYDVEADRTEQHDLAAGQPERVRQMAAQWDAWATRADVLPLGTWRGAQTKPKFNRARRFEFPGPAHLTQEQAPMVKECAIAIEVKVAKPADGVLAAQGGIRHGYSLYIEQHRLTFALRRNGELTVVAAEEPLPPQTREVAASLRPEAIELSADGREVASAASPGLLPAMPVDGFDIGRDAGDPVSNYTGPFPFTGEIQSVTVVLDDLRGK